MEGLATSSIPSENYIDLSGSSTAASTSSSLGSQFRTAKDELAVQKRMIEEDVKGVTPPKRKKHKPNNQQNRPIPKRQLVDLTESDDDDDVIDRDALDVLRQMERDDALDDITNLPSSSSSRRSPSGPWDRGAPIWAKKRDEALLRRYGTLNPAHRRSSGGPSEPPRAAVPKHAPAKPSDEPELSPQQAEILEKIMLGESVFFTGAAGTGKSVLLRAIKQAFEKKASEAANPRAVGGKSWELACTASTGMAAINIGGSTLHSWAGIFKGEEPVGILTAKVIKYLRARQRWERTTALIIDEISMIDGRLFDKLEHIGRTIRKNQKPFGGLQLILCGDFHQLPPVAKRGDPPAVYAFECAAWKRIFTSSNSLCLKQVFRQKDATFIRILEEMRKGRISARDEAKIIGLSRKLVFPDGVPPVELYPTRGEVDYLNTTKLNALPSEAQTFTAIDLSGRHPNGSDVSPDQMVQMLNSMTTFQPEITLKVGAIVMLLQNHTTLGLCNGSTGKVVDFMTVADCHANGVVALGEDASKTVWPVVEFVPGKYVDVPTPKRVGVCRGQAELNNPDGSLKASRHQVPLILAWGLTVHKAQGQSLERVKVDLHRTFADGQAYVAMSRATSMEGLEVVHFNASKLKASNRVIEWSLTIEGDV